MFDEAPVVFVIIILYRGKELEWNSGRGMEIRSIVDIDVALWSSSPQTCTYKQFARFSFFFCFLACSIPLENRCWRGFVVIAVVDCDDDDDDSMMVIGDSMMMKG